MTRYGFTAYNERRAAIALHRGRTIADLYQQGMPQHDIAKRLHIGQTTVSTWVKRLGVSRSARAGLDRATTDARAIAMASRYLDGRTLNEVAAEFGITAAGVHYQLKRLGVVCRHPMKPRTFPVFDAFMLLLQGETPSEVTAKLGCKQPSIYGCLRARDLRLHDIPRYADVLSFGPEALEAFRAALMDDGLSFPDAYEIALEYQPQRRAA